MTPGIVLHFTIEHIKDMAGSAAFERGEQYFNTRRARIVEYTPGQSHFVAEVRGSEPRPYRVKVEFDYILTGTCSCPVRLDCKHAVAAALEWLHQYEISARAALASGQEPVLPVVENDSPAPLISSAEPLSPLDEWLTHIPPAQPPQSDVLQPGSHYLLYELKVLGQQVQVSLKKSYLKKDGQWSQFRAFTPDYFALQWRRPDHVREQDMAILQLLPRLSGNAYAELTGEAGRLALEHMLNTHRLMLNDVEVSRGPAAELQWRWQELDGKQQLKAALEGHQQWVAIPVMPPCYLDLGTARIGDIQTPLAASQVLHLMSMPAIPQQRLQEVAVRLRQNFDSDDLPVPVELPEIVDVDDPLPLLTLISINQHAGTLPAAQLHFEYAGQRMIPDYDSQGTHIPELVEYQGRYVRIRRNLQREKDLADRLFALGLRLYQRLGDYDLIWAAKPDSTSVMVEFWEDFLADAVPQLQSQGWLIENADDVELEVDQATFDFEMKDVSNHWFELALSLPIGGGRKLETAEAVEMWLEQGSPDTMVVAVD
ncbi:MAG TPA: SWIM zinc finger family protein, partial [Pseudohongiella sp.]|nr:SWIM zinc finger family protein [Pseudohongiella sp.]